MTQLRLDLQFPSTENRVSGIGGLVEEAVAAPPNFEAVGETYFTGAPDHARIEMPTGIQAGDLLICVAGVWDASVATPKMTMQTNDNWVELADVNGSGGDTRRLQAWYKFAHGDESDGVTIDMGNTSTFVGQIMRFSGVATTPISVTVQTSESGATTANNYDAPSIAAGDNSTVLVAAIASDNIVTNPLTIGNGATAIGQGVGTTSGIDRICLVTGYKQFETGETTGVFNITGADSSDHWNAITVVIDGGDASSFGTPPVDSDYASVGLLYRFPQEAPLSDDGPNGATLTENGGSLWSFRGRGEGGGIRLNNTNYYSIAGATGDQPYKVPAGEFTYEFWYYVDAGSQSDGILGLWNGSGNYSYLFFTSLGKLRFYYSTDGTSNPFLEIAPQPSTLTWHHIAVDRNSSNLMRIYLDGVVEDSATVSGALHDPGTSADFNVGAYGNGANNSANFYYIDQIRLTKGVCRYDGAFTVPDWPFAIRAS